MAQYAYGLKSLPISGKEVINNPTDMNNVLESGNKLQHLGFVDYVDNLSHEDRDMIHNSGVNYFITWRAVWYENSLSTPCRLLFNASQSTKD